MIAIFRTRPVIGACLLSVFALLTVGCDRSQADTWVDIGGYKLGVHCEGEGSPVVVLDAGGGGNSGTWRAVQPSVAEFTRVCSYDRAGLANSEDRPDRDIDGGYVADELERLLRGLDLDPPYVFVGHSVGAIYTSLYAARNPARVGGLVFVDPTTEDQFAAFDAEWQIPHFADEGGSHVDWTTTVPELQSAPGYGDAPTVSLDSGKIDNPIWLDLRQALAQKSTNSMLVVADGAGHSIQKEAPEVVIRSIKLVVDSARSGDAMPACEPSFADLDATCEPVR